MLGKKIDMYLMLAHKVAEILLQLHHRSWIIGHLSPSFVFADPKDYSKVCFLMGVGKWYNTKQNNQTNK